MARSFLRRIGSLTFSASATQQLELPRNHVFKMLLCVLEGTYDVAGGTGAGQLHDEQPMSLVRDLRIVRNGADTPQALDGGSFYAIGQYDHRVAPQRTQIPNLAAGSSSPFRADIPITFPLMGFPAGTTFLEAVGNSSLFLECTWGTTGSLGAGLDGTPSFSVTPTLTVYGVELMDLQGPWADRNLHAILSPVTASTTEHEVDLPVGPIYRRIFIKATTQKTGPVAGSEDFDLNNAVVNSINGLILDGQLYLMRDYNDLALQGINKLDRKQETLLEGYTVIDFAADGNPTGMIPTAGASDFKLLLDVTFAAAFGTHRVRVIPETITPARQGV